MSLQKVSAADQTSGLWAKIETKSPLAVASFSFDTAPADGERYRVCYSYVQNSAIANLYLSFTGGAGTAHDALWNGYLAGVGTAPGQVLDTYGVLLTHFSYPPYSTSGVFGEVEMGQDFSGSSNRWVIGRNVAKAAATQAIGVTTWGLYDGVVAPTSIMFIVSAGTMTGTFTLQKLI